MTDIALFTQAPSYCSRCGGPIDVTSNEYRRADWLAHSAHSCPGCGLNFQLVEEEHAIAAATASDGDLAQWINR